jgi:hypothetical protein
MGTPDTPFHPGDEKFVRPGAEGLGVEEPLPENRQEAAIAELERGLAALTAQHREITEAFAALQARVASYEANHGNL